MAPPHLGEVDATKCELGEKHHGAFAERTGPNAAQAVSDGFRTVRASPRLADFGFGLLNGNSIRRVRHLERLEIQPVSRPGQPSCLEKAIVERSRGIRSHEAVNGQSRRPMIHYFLSAPGHARSVAVHSENKRCDRVNPALGQPIQRQFVICGFVETLVNRAEAGRIDRFQPDENPSPTACRDQVQKLFVF